MVWLDNYYFVIFVKKLSCPNARWSHVTNIFVFQTDQKYLTNLNIFKVHKILQETCSQYLKVYYSRKIMVFSEYWGLIILWNFRFNFCIMSNWNLMLRKIIYGIFSGWFLNFQNLVHNIRLQKNVVCVTNNSY